ncbi:MAG: hypothetical protein LBV72_13935 [Tannerella sp.]|jgi:hypothetical protein|nr:hypothetical protein [Tannerella sp.]
MKKLPPIEKIYEALSAIADNRITIEDESAKVQSSDYTKEYTVKWKDNTYSSNDNASYWGGYAGYPVIGVFLLQGKLKLQNAELVNLLKGINWKALNTKYKNKYDKAVAEILGELEAEDMNALKTEVDHIYEDIKNLDLETKRSSLRPPK